jgi:hypothetical protein
MEQLHLKPDQNWDGQIVITEYDAVNNTIGYFKFNAENSDNNPEGLFSTRCLL